MFDEKGQIIISKEELEDNDIEVDADELMMLALDAVLRLLRRGRSI